MHLLATISAHGFGHLAQTAPVLNALRRLRPALRLTIASTLPEARLRQRIDGPFAIEAHALDIGFAMHDAFTVALVPSAAAYRDFHADWIARVERTVRWMAGMQPDLVLANVAYLPLAAAARLGVPAIGMSSLNWADLFAALFGAEAWAAPLHEQMLQAYRSATTIVRLTPGMAMPELDNAVWAGPVAAPGRPRRDELRRRLGAAGDERVVLVAFGGLDRRLPIESWPRAQGLHWLVPAAWGTALPRVHAIESLGWPFADLMASVDGLIGKPGYGTFVEAACCGTPVLYAPRPHWPEQAPLVRWLHAHARAREVSAEALERGALADALAELLARPAPPLVVPTGVDEVAARLARYGPA